MTTQLSQYADCRFVARLDHIQNLLSGVKALNYNENGAFQVSAEGIRLTVEHGQSTQASLFITRSCFVEYFVAEEDMVNFSVNINVLCECLGIFQGMECSLKMYQKKNENMLMLILQPQDEDNEVCTECALKITEYEDPIEFDLNEATLNAIFIRGPDICHLFNELDKSAEELEIVFASHAPHFKITALGVMQLESSVEVAKSSEMILMFECRGETTARYSNTQMRLTQKALAVASKVAMKTDNSGLLEMHFMLHSEAQAQIYLQFFIAPLVEEDF